MSSAHSFDFSKEQLLRAANQVQETVGYQVENIRRAVTALEGATTADELENAVDTILSTFRSTPSNARTDLLVKYLAAAARAEGHADGAWTEAG